MANAVFLFDPHAVLDADFLMDFPDVPVCDGPVRLDWVHGAYAVVQDFSHNGCDYSHVAYFPDDAAAQRALGLAVSHVLSDEDDPDLPYAVRLVRV